MNVYRTTNPKDVQFDFLVHEMHECDYDAEIKERGGAIYRLPRFSGINSISYYSKCKRFFQEHHEYSAVHGHIGSCAALYLSAAKQAGLYAIAHSHNTKGGGLGQRAFDVVSYPTRFIADAFLACSQEAGTDRFGAKVASGENFRVVNNGILIESYCFEVERRLTLRKSLGINRNAPVFCHVGRFTPQKNHEFLIEAFALIVRHLPNAILLLAGRGELEDSVKADVASRGLSGNIKFLGVRDDIPDVLMASDVFLFPSKWEGLGIAAIEAQATGLPCLLSDALPSLSKVTEHALFLPLDAGAETWAHAAVAALDVQIPRSQQIALVRSAGFDISDTTDKLVNLYESHRLWSAL